MAAGAVFRDKRLDSRLELALQRRRSRGYCGRGSNGKQGGNGAKIHRTAIISPRPAEGGGLRTFSSVMRQGAGWLSIWTIASAPLTYILTEVFR
jgi:hypothetical protein